MPLLQNSLYLIAERRKNGFRNYKKRKAEYPLADKIPMSPEPHALHSLLQNPYRTSELSNGVSKYPITHLIIHVTSDPCHLGSGHFLPCTLLNVFLICLNCRTTWHSVNGRMTQVIFKRPYYKGGSFPFGRWKGLGHILPWPCLGSEWGKERWASQSPFPTLLATRSLRPLPSPTFRHLQEQRDRLPCRLRKGSVAPGQRCCPFHRRTKHVSLGGRTASASLCPSLAPRMRIHPYRPHAHLLLGSPSWPFVLTFLMGWQVGSRVPRVIIL